jgi:hypothetical protein
LQGENEKSLKKVVSGKTGGWGRDVSGDQG